MEPVHSERPDWADPKLLTGHEPQPCHCEARSAAAVHGPLPQATAAWMAAGLTALGTTEMAPLKTRHREERSDAAIHTAVPLSPAVWTAAALRASQ